MEATKTEPFFCERTSKKQRFDKRLIEHIVDLEEQGVPRRDLIKEYGMNGSTLSYWLGKYGSGIRKRKSYTAAEKRSVVRAIEAGMGMKQALVTYNISYPSVVRRWIAVFKEENAEISSPKPLEMADRTTDPPTGADIKALRKALDEANLKIKALDTMIDIAEEQLKVDIRKKSGAKRSSK